MKKLLTILVLIIALSCTKESELYPLPPYPDPDVIMYFDLGVVYEWKCMDGVYVTISFYYCKGKWIKQRRERPGLCMEDIKISKT